jgi:hypothetical protein
MKVILLAGGGYCWQPCKRCFLLSHHIGFSHNKPQSFSYKLYSTLGYWDARACSGIVSVASSTVAHDSTKSIVLPSILVEEESHTLLKCLCIIARSHTRLSRCSRSLTNCFSRHIYGSLRFSKKYSPSLHLGGRRRPHFIKMSPYEGLRYLI